MTLHPLRWIGSARTRRAAFAAVALLAGLGSAARADYVAATWSDQSVHILDQATLSSLGSFTVGSTLPNGIATDGALIWAGFFTSQEVIAYNLAGVEQFRWSAAIPSLQGMELVGRELAIQNNTVIDFFDPFTGAFLRSIPSQGGTVEGLAYDGTLLWQLDDDIIGTDPLTGAVITTIPNPAIGDPFTGTGLTYSGPNELTVAGANGNWYKISSINGALLASGNNGLDMYGLKHLVPEPSSVALSLVGGLALAAFARRRRAAR